MTLITAKKKWAGRQKGCQNGQSQSPTSPVQIPVQRPWYDRRVLSDTLERKWAHPYIHIITHPPPTLTLTSIHSHPQSHTLLSPYPSEPHSHIQNTHPHHLLCSPTLTATFTFTHKPTSTPAHLHKLCTYKRTHPHPHPHTRTQVHTNTYRHTYKLAARHAFMHSCRRLSGRMPCPIFVQRRSTHLLDQPLLCQSFIASVKQLQCRFYTLDQLLSQAFTAMSFIGHTSTKRPT